MEFIHPYSRYGLALIFHKYSIESIESTHLVNELTRGLNHFRTTPKGLIDGQQQVKFGYLTQEFIQQNSKYKGSGDSIKGIFLCPNIIATDKSARLTWAGIESLIQKLKKSLKGKENLTQAISAPSAKFNNGKKSPIYPSVSRIEVACAGITNITPIKPCLAYKTQNQGRTKRTNSAIIPDLPLAEMIKFIAFFEMMLTSETSDDLMIGKVGKTDTKTRDQQAEERHFNKTKKKVKIFKSKYTPWRPKIFDGNFPNPPFSSALGSIALLGAIGEWAKESKNWEEGKSVLESLKDVALYMISYGNAKSFRYNHYIIDLAKEARLSSVIDAIYYTKLFNTESRSQNKHEYEKFDLFVSRFLLLFNRPAFKDFLAFRAEYPYQLELLFTTYFTKMEKIPIEIVQSAKKLGQWLNYVAYLAALSENNDTESNEFKKAKAKTLVEMESSVFSSKTGAALVAQVITRAGRISNQDAPSEAALFIENTSSGELPLDAAKNLLMAFSRLWSKPKENAIPDMEIESPKEDTSEYAEN